VGAADYVVWRNTNGNEVGATRALEADGNADGMVDSTDYDLWLAQFGAVANASAGAAIAVPEPASWWLLAAILVWPGRNLVR
jgi:hypothetical protein